MLTRLSASQLEVNYGTHVALRIPELSVEGKIIAIIGQNGSGKSTFIKTTLELLVPRRGNFAAEVIGGARVERLVPERDMAFSPENGAVFADMSVESYVKLWCRLKGKNANFYKREGSHYIERLALEPLLPKLGRELSKGQRRRVQCAVGFLSQPRLFLFDEPFDGLDIGQSNQLTSIMLEESPRMSMVVSSHRMEVVERLADVIVVLYQGGVVASGPVAEVCAQLCSQSYLLTATNGTVAHFDSLAHDLRAQFQSCFVSLVGAQITIAGRGISTDELSSFLRGRQLSDVIVRTSQPSLVDAMNYHIKSVHQPLSPADRLEANGRRR